MTLPPAGDLDVGEFRGISQSSHDHAFPERPAQYAYPLFLREKAASRSFQSRGGQGGALALGRFWVVPFGVRRRDFAQAHEAASLARRSGLRREFRACRSLRALLPPVDPELAVGRHDEPGQFGEGARVGLEPLEDVPRISETGTGTPKISLEAPRAEMPIPMKVSLPLRKVLPGEVERIGKSEPEPAGTDWAAAGEEQRSGCASRVDLRERLERGAGCGGAGAG